MKYLVFCIFVIANISDNGKASLDSFSPASANILLEDTTRNTDKSCFRPCKLNVKPRQCYYKFLIEPSLQPDGKPAITINGKSPGPPINVCLNDVIIVDVKNKIPDQDLSMHWHGIEQVGTPYMDGVPMITQCPIGYGSTYRYAFIASSPGTFFYHADSVSHQSDGVYGALTVNQPSAFEPNLSLYDYDRSDEHTVIIAAKFPELMTGNLNAVNDVKPSSLVVNEGENYKMPGFAYKLRFINAIAIECPVLLRIDSHEMIVIATDGRPVKPVSADSVLLYPGERMDVVVRTTEDKGGYWLRVRGSGVCSGLHTSTMFLYTGHNYTNIMAEQNQTSFLENTKFVFGQQLQSYQDQVLSPTTHVRKHYLGIDKKLVDFNEKQIDFKYSMDSLPQKPFYPASLSFTGAIQINNKSFLYPSSPILLNPSDTNNVVCEVGKEAAVVDPQCLQVIYANKGDIIELALVNEGFAGTDSYTFHMHGYGMQVVATSRNAQDLPLSQDDFQSYDTKGMIPRNLISPPIKDTITVPNKGFAIVRIRIDRGGSWLLECRSCGFASLPTAVVIQVPQEIPKTVVDSLPKCGSFKPPDVLLN